MSAAVFYSAVGVLTLTTFVSTVGGFMHHIQWKGVGDIWMPALYPGTNALSRFFLGLYQTDWVITLGALGNLVIFLLLGWKVIQPFVPLGKRRLGRLASD